MSGKELSWRFGGRVLKTSLAKDAEEQLQEALHGSDHRRRDPVEPAPAPAGAS